MIMRKYVVPPDSARRVFKYPSLLHKSLRDWNQSGTASAPRSRPWDTPLAPAFTNKFKGRGYGVGQHWGSFLQTKLLRVGIKLLKCLVLSRLSNRGIACPQAELANFQRRSRGELPQIQPPARYPGPKVERPGEES